MHTGLGRSQVEVQRCTLSWEGPRNYYRKNPSVLFGELKVAQKKIISHPSKLETCVFWWLLVGEYY